MTTIAAPHDLLLAGLHTSLADPAMTSMNLLNEISIRYPEAVSFAAGRPAEQFFETDAVHRHLDRYLDHLRTERGLTEEQARRQVLQYGRTKGIIHDLIATHLATDEGIEVPAESIVVTVGCQEAMFLVLRALRRGPEDVVLAVSPTYVGLTGAALLADLPGGGGAARPPRGGHPPPRPPRAAPPAPGQRPPAR
ncbi:PLP-dependent aminotransferase family protein, partial [Kitasatospora sp. NPDC048298]